ncbi:hypothetical protein VTK73DRAFT_6075 [Phialemonium thermophilum]|uniref:Acid phosphatase n=1 Tax=Phialemonium thermophilum TaxID=223376 RepID=A0ABR3WKX2_9PEZI
MRADTLALLATAGVAVAQSQTTMYTATRSADVAAARATAKTLSPTSHVKGKAFDRFVIIWLENTDYDLALGDPNLAWLAKKGITLSNYFGVTHPSEPNYVAAIGGDYWGMDNDNFNFIDKNISTVIDLLEARGISWSEYQEDMPYSGFEGFQYLNQVNGKNDYVRKHNPAVIYDSVSAETDRLAKIKNLTYFYEDLRHNALPQWMFITPNMTSDGHDTTVTVAGSWTRSFLEPLLDDDRFMNNTLVLVTFDENATYAKQNRVLGILLGDAVPCGRVGTTDPNFYNHYSEIATVQANWDLPTLGRWDVGANVFQVVGDATGDQARPYAGLDRRFYNQSYPGVFNSNPAGAQYPKPNLCLKRDGRSVAPLVRDTWKGSKNPVYYDGRLEVPDGLNPPVVLSRRR